MAFSERLMARVIFWLSAYELKREQDKSEGFESCDRPIVRKRPIWVKIGDVLYRVTLKFDGWPGKTKGHLSFAVSSSVQHFIAIGEFKMELQSANANLGQIRRFLEPCDLEDWRMTSNKANLRDLIAATGLVISNSIQIVNFSACVTVKFDGWPCKTTGHLFYATSSCVHHFVPIGEFKLKLQSGNAQSGSNLTIFRAMRPWNLRDDLAKQ